MDRTPVGRPPRLIPDTRQPGVETPHRTVLLTQQFGRKRRNIAAPIARQHERLGHPGEHRDLLGERRLFRRGQRVAAHQASEYLSYTKLSAAVSAVRQSAPARAPPSFWCYHAPAVYVGQNSVDGRSLPCVNRAVAKSMIEDTSEIPFSYSPQRSCK